MNNGVLLLMALFWGLFLGVFYFGGLWLTVRRLPRMNSGQGVWLFFSFLTRILLVLAGMWIVLQENPMAFFIALLSFFMVRPVLTKTAGRGCRES